MSGSGPHSFAAVDPALEVQQFIWIRAAQLHAIIRRDFALARVRLLHPIEFEIRALRASRALGGPSLVEKLLGPSTVPYAIRYTDGPLGPTLPQP